MVNSLNLFSASRFIVALKNKYIFFKYDCNSVITNTVMKAMCPLFYLLSDFVATHALRHLMHLARLHITGANEPPKSAQQTKQGA